jgi:hypothetical protein
MKIEIHTIGYQIYVIPFIKITYNKILNGKYELIVGWLNKAISISV